MKKFFNILVGCLAFVGAFISILYIYVLCTKTDIYKGSTSTYALNVVDPATGNKLPPLSLNYYENFNGTGKEVIEFRINAYSDQKKQALYCKGFQLVIEKNGDSKLYYYDSYNGESWDSGHVYDDTNDDGQYKNFFYIDIEGKLTAVRLDGSYEADVQNNVPFLRRMGNAITNFLTFRWSKNSQKDYCNEYVKKTFYYNYTDLLLKLKSIVRSSSYGTGSYVMDLVDLGDFLHMYSVDSSGTVSDKPIGNDGQINSYFSISVNYDKRGMVYAGQSMFKSVALDSDFNISGIDFDVNYWKKTIEFNLTEQNFERRYSSIDSGFYYSLSSKFISELKTFMESDMEINIVFDCTHIKDTKILGFDNYALYGLKINSLKIIGNGGNFNLLVGSIKNTGLTKIVAQNITINNFSGVEVEYEVV